MENRQTLYHVSRIAVGFVMNIMLGMVIFCVFGFVSHAQVVIVDGKSFNTDLADASFDISERQDGAIKAYVFNTDRHIIVSGTGKTYNYGHRVGDTLPIFDEGGANRIIGSPYTVYFDGDIVNIGNSLFYSSNVVIKNLPEKNRVYWKLCFL